MIIEIEVDPNSTESERKIVESLMLIRESDRAAIIRLAISRGLDLVCGNTNKGYVMSATEMHNQHYNPTLDIPDMKEKSGENITTRKQPHEKRTIVRSQESSTSEKNKTKEDDKYDAARMVVGSFS